MANDFCPECGSGKWYHSDDGDPVCYCVAVETHRRELNEEHGSDREPTMNVVIDQGFWMEHLGSPVICSRCVRWRQSLGPCKCGAP